MQQSSPSQAIVDRQVQAFNNHDADAFAALYAPDATILSALSDESPLVGRAAIADHYRQLFKNLPAVTVSIEQRILVANLVTDSEHIEPLGQKALVTYQVEEGLIRRAWMFGPLPA
jgi:uncharacterized protein (TIGR02246 family)